MKRILEKKKKNEEGRIEGEHTHYLLDPLAFKAVPVRASKSLQWNHLTMRRCISGEFYIEEAVLDTASTPPAPA